MKKILFTISLSLLFIFSSCSNTKSAEDINKTNDTTLTLLGSTPPASGHDINPKSWMSLLQDDVLISDITIPGTHDSAAYKGSSDTSGHVLTQSKTIKQQLEIGIRWFDLRVNVDGDGDDAFLGMYHGDGATSTYLDQSFGSVLETLKNYTKNHRSETVMIIIKQENSSVSDKRFSKLIRNKMKSNGISNFDLKKDMPLLGDVRGKIVVFRRFDLGGYSKDVGRRIVIKDRDSGSGHNNHHFKYVTQDSYRVDQGAKNDKDKICYKCKVTLIKSNMDNALKDDGKRLFINFASAYDKGANDTNRDVAKFINDGVDKHAKDMKGKGRAGAIFINFAGTTGDGLTPHLVKHIIEINKFTSSPWTKDILLKSSIGSNTQYGGIAIGDIKGDGYKRLVSLYIDNPKGENTAKYNISTPIKKDGKIDKIIETKTIPTHIGSRTDGAGVAIGDIDNNGYQEMVLFFIDETKDTENKAYYSVGSKFNTNSQVWTDRIRINGHFGTHNSGAGIAMNDFDNDGGQNLIIFFIDNPDGENKSYYKVSNNIKADGSIKSIDSKQWSQRMQVPAHFGSENSGAGITIGDIDNDGGQNLIVSFIDSRTNSENAAFYMVSSNINPDGSVDSWSKRKQIYGWMGRENQAAGITTSDIDYDNKEDLIFYFVDNPEKENSNYYKVGFNKDVDNSLLLKAY